MSNHIQELLDCHRELPPEIEAQVKLFAQPCAATLRPNWREGSFTINTMKNNDNLIRYHIYNQWLIERAERRRKKRRRGRRGGMEKWTQNVTRNFIQWCKWKNILVPILPPPRNGECQSKMVGCCGPFGVSGFCFHGWNRGVPDWAKEEFILHRIHLTYEGYDEHNNEENDTEWIDR